MFADIKERLKSPKQLEPIKGIYFAEILYADDTLIFGDHTASINHLLKEIEQKSTYYNMNLNYRKCINLTCNQKTSSIKNQDASTVPRQRQAVYLGTILSDTIDNKLEIHNRLAMVTRTCGQFKLFWSKANTSTKWKLQVFNAIIKTKFVYNLETIQLTQNEMDKIDAFQIKCIRRVLRIPPTFIDRSQTNQTVRDAASQYNVDMTRFSETWKMQKLKLFGHIVRARHNDPLRQVLFDYGTYFPRTFPNKKGGTTKNGLATGSFEGCLSRARLIVPRAFNHINVSHLVEAAISRSGPFSRRTFLPSASGLTG